MRRGPKLVAHDVWRGNPYDPGRRGAWLAKVGGIGECCPKAEYFAILITN